MARSVTFNGITRYRPGGITRINAEALNQIGISAANVVGLVGEADGGEPGSSAGLVRLNDPSRATDLFRSGPLVDAIRLAFQSSGDPRVPGGAAEVLVYKTNESTQASAHIPDIKGQLATDLVDAASTTTNVTLAALTPTADDYIGRWASVGIASTPSVASLTATGGSTTTFEVAGTADQYVGYMVKFDSATTTVALQDEWATIIANDGTTLTFAETLPAAVANTDELAVYVPERRKITDNSTSAIDVSPALSAAPVAGDYVVIHPTLFTVTSEDYGVHTNNLEILADLDASDGTYTVTVVDGDDEVTSESLGGTNYLKLMYRGGANAVAPDVIDTDAPPTRTSLTLVTGGLTPSAHDGATAVVTNPATGNSEQVVISTNSATALTLEGDGISADFLTEILAADADTVVVDIKTVTNATATITGASGVATGLSSTITGVTGDDLSVTFATGETLTELAARINQNANYYAVVGDGVNGDTALAADFDFGSGTQIEIQQDVSLTDSGFQQNIADVVAWFNDVNGTVNALRYTDDASDGGYLATTAALHDVTFDEEFILTGGQRGTSTNSSFQAGLDELLLENCNNVVPLIDQNLAEEGNGSTATWASVSAQLADHVTRARGAVGRERGGFIGFRGTKSAVIAAANDLNDQDVQLVCQSPTVLNAEGTLEEMGPRMLAVMGASMRSGVEEVGEPLTHKFLRLSGLTQDSSWDPSDVTDSTDLIKAGVFFAETIAGLGTRWVRDLTTWVKNDNLAYAEGSVRSVVRFVAYNLRTELENRYTGRKAAPATINSVKNTAATLLELYRSADIIVDSTDPTTGATIRAYHNLKVFSSGDILTLNVGIFPVPGINFQLNDIYLQLPTQSAA